LPRCSFPVERMPLSTRFLILFEAIIIVQRVVVQRVVTKHNRIQRLDSQLAASCEGNVDTTM
jgi:hypothetical protein